MLSEVTELPIPLNVANDGLAANGEARFMTVYWFDQRIRPVRTTGPVLDPQVMVSFRQELLPPTAYPRPTTHVVDISDMIPSPGALYELVVPLGQQIRGGMNGNSRLVFATPDFGVSETVRLLAKEHHLPLFLSTSSAPEDVERAIPAGRITEAESDALEALRRLGGQARASEIAKELGLEPSAAHNRLDTLARNGYVFRFKRPRSIGDLYVDPRMQPSGINPDETARVPMRKALQAAGITSDPYDRSPLQLEGEAAERVAEILKRRGKAG